MQRTRSLVIWYEGISGAENSLIKLDALVGFVFLF